VEGMMTDKKADLAGPGISTYEEVDKILPRDYQELLGPKDRMKALFRIKNFIEQNLCKELNLFMVPVPLIVSKDSGVNDYLDRDGSRTPVEFSCGLGLEEGIEGQVVQAATKWKRMALRQFGCEVGEGICTDMRAVRKDYFLDHDHSAYVDQWDWELVINKGMRNLDFLHGTVEKIWSVIYEADQMIKKDFPELNTVQYPDIPKKIEFFHAEEIMERYPDFTRKQRETKMVQEVHPAIFIIGIGSVLEDGYPHEMRATDYDDWITPTIKKNGKQFHGLNGDILVWNPVTKRRHELTSMGIRVTKKTMVQQLKESGQEHFLELPYHQAVLNDEIPLSIGGGIGQSRTFMYLLRTAHIGEVSVTVWPDVLKSICKKKNIHILE
jgi:aspartate--ammonia ligase